MSHKPDLDFNRHELVPDFYRTVSPKLITRFKEREENVKSDIFGAYSALLKQSRPVSTSGSTSPSPSPLDAEMMDMDEGAAAARTPVAMLVGQVSVIATHNSPIYNEFQSR